MQAISEIKEKAGVKEGRMERGERGEKEERRGKYGEGGMSQRQMCSVILSIFLVSLLVP